MFLLIERDPFVRTDMCLTLGEAFPQVEVISLDSVDAARQAPRGLHRPRLVLIDTLPGDPAGVAQVAVWWSERTPVLLTNAGRVHDAALLAGATTGPTGGSRLPPQELPRPFTTQMLVQAVQSAMRTMA